MDWEWFAGQLNQYRYDGPITLEVSCQDAAYQGMSMEDYLAEAFRRAKRLLGLIEGRL